MPPKKKAQTPGDAPTASVAPTTRVTRQTKAQAEAEAEAEAEAKAEPGQKTPQESRSGRLRGNYQPSTLPRRNAPPPPRSESPESIATEDFDHSQYDITERFSPEKRSPEKRIPQKQRESPILEETELSDGGDPVNAEEIEDSLQEIIEFTLPDLETWAGRIYDVVVKAQSAAPDKHSWNRLALVEKNFNENRQKIASPERYFIHLSDIYNSVRPIEQTEHFEFAANIICSANTALLLKLALQLKHGGKQIKMQNMLDELDTAFPGMFESSSRRRTSEERLLAYDRAFRIRYCLLAENIRSRNETSPAILAAELFCSGQPPEQVKQARQMLLQGPYEPLGGFVLGKSADLAARHSNNMEELCSVILSQEDRTELAIALADAYPVQDLWDELTQWAHETFQSIHGSMDDGNNKTHAAYSQPISGGQGSSQNPAASSGNNSNAMLQKGGTHRSEDERPGEQYNEERDEELQIERQLNQERPDEEQIEISNGDDQDTLFVAEALSESDSGQEEYVVRTERLEASYFDGSARLANDSVAGGRPRATPPSNQQAVKNPFASLNAEEIVNSYRATQSSAAQHSSQSGPSRSHSTSRKRLAPNDLQDDVGDDDVFEFNDKRWDEGRRTTHTRQAFRSSPKRLRVTKDRTATTSRDRRSVPLLAGPQHDSADLQPDDISLLTQRSRAATRKYREPRPPQRRERWSDADTAVLINEIPHYMCAWSQMEEAALFQTFRTQQQIRDKARNIKVEFLKTDDPLPAGFDGIALGRKEMEAIKALHKNPSRREDDLDINGRVINNIWGPELGIEERRHRRSQEAD